jgi:DNA uptake protein ComE-like DNA-binding protein
MGIFGGRKPAASENIDESPAFPTPQRANPAAPSQPIVSEPQPTFGESLIADLQASNAALLASVAGVSPSGFGNSQPAAQSGAINLNTATQSRLESLPGIGRSLAKAIIENRPYATLDDLRRVPRLGDSAIKRIAPLVEF